MTLLTVDGLSKSYGGVAAARDVSFTVDAGRMVAIIGPNGAGKSTTFNMVGGQVRPDAGRVTLDGRDVTGWRPRHLWRAGIGRTFQVAQTFVSMTVAENVQVALIGHHGRGRAVIGRATSLYRDEAHEILAAFGLAQSAGRAVAELAYGDVKRLELAIALASRPKLLLMDEPTAGMAPAERSGLMRAVTDLARTRQIGVLYTEHDMDAVFGHADEVIVLVRGGIIARGSPDDVRADAQVRRVYLGERGALVALRRKNQPDTQKSRRNSARTAQPPLLRVEGLTARYGLARVLYGIDLTLERGEVLALVGRNGAGKSTTLKAIMGLIDRTAAGITFAGHDIRTRPTYRIAELGLGYVPEDRRIFTDLTVAENLEVGRRAVAYARAPWTPERLFEIFPNLADMRGRRASAISGGEQQMLTIARTLMGNPLAVLLDEPSEGLAPVIIEQMASAIIAMTSEGLAVLLSEQNLQFAGAVAHRATVIETGQIRFTGTMAELEANAAVRDAYLGV